MNRKNSKEGRMRLKTIAVELSQLVRLNQETLYRMGGKEMSTPMEH